MDPVAQLLDLITQSPPVDGAAMRRLKARVARGAGLPFARNDALLERYRQDVASGERARDGRVERTLRLNRIRSESGVATVTVITEPYACPGRCVYCPTEARAPKSYLTNEPAVLRALRHDYDPYGQVLARLAALRETGHATDKVELIVKGGTWSFYPESYQDGFIARCFEAANDFGEGIRAKGEGTTAVKPTPSPCALRPAPLDHAQRINETAESRIIGLTIETRPDYVTPDEIRRLRRLGVTRVELGVQSLEEDVLALTVRDHGTEAVRLATRLLKDAAFKVAYHLMPNLPGATPASDLDTARAIFTDPAYQPDAVKLYPCVVIESAELHRWWREGRYAPYDDETLVELLIAIKQLVPPTVRIERVIRDIPSTSIRAGCLVTNLREEAQRQMRIRGQRCRCLRCRQVREEIAGRFALIRRDGASADAREIFLSFEEPRRDQLASFLRLRILQGAGTAPGLERAALVRELHSYGRHLPLAERSGDAVQHQGFGRRLLAEAERIARDEFGRSRIAVIAGVGARAYYRKFGYELEETYMVKGLG
jgi:elongator complex protein 3